MVSYNMEGLGNSPAVLEIRNKVNPEIIALQETWLRSYRNAEFAEMLRSHYWIFKNADSQLNEEDMVTMKNLSFHGVALGVDETLREKVSEINVQHRNMIAIKLNLEQKHLIVNLYLPTRGKDLEFEEAVDAVKVILEENAEDGDIVTLMGDLNVSTSSSTRRKLVWSSLLTEFDLQDNITGVNTHLHHSTGAVASSTGLLRGE